MLINLNKNNRAYFLSIAITIYGSLGLLTVYFTEDFYSVVALMSGFSLVRIVINTNAIAFINESYHIII